MTGARNPRREVAAVAAALLLPVPLLALTAVHLPLPGAVERGLASITPEVFEAPARKAVPAPPLEAAPEQAPVDDVAEASSSAFVQAPAPPTPADGPAGGASTVADEDGQADQPQGGGAEPPETLPPDTGSDDGPTGDDPDVPPPVAPQAPATIAAPAEVPAPPEATVGIDAGGVSAEIEIGTGADDATVSAGDLVPPTTLTLP